MPVFLLSYPAVPYREYRRKLGLTIRAYRKQAGLTQDQLSEEAELSPKYFGEVERGLVNFSLGAMVRIAKAMKITVHDLTRGL